MSSQGSLDETPVFYNFFCCNIPIRIKCLELKNVTLFALYLKSKIKNSFFFACGIRMDIQPWSHRGVILRWIAAIREKSIKMRRN